MYITCNRDISAILLGQRDVKGVEHRKCPNHYQILQISEIKKKFAQTPVQSWRMGNPKLE
jgi:hypothetical protein